MGERERAGVGSRFHKMRAVPAPLLPCPRPLPHTPLVLGQRTPLAVK